MSDFLVDDIVDQVPRNDISDVFEIRCEADDFGAAFAFLHDIADIFIMAARTFGETNHSNIAGGIFACAIIVWFYTRIVVLPYLIYLVIISEVKVGYCSKEIFVYLLSCMFVLHCYWFFLFFKIIKKFIVTGVAEDTVNKVESNKQK